MSDLTIREVELKSNDITMYINNDDGTILLQTISDLDNTQHDVPISMEDWEIIKQIAELTKDQQSNN